jgi:hypothetical protein
LKEVLHEIVADFVGKYRVVQVHLRESRDSSHDNFLDAWLTGGGDRDGIAIAAQTGCDP